MRTGPELETSRLVLRRWRPSDLKPFAEMNADTTVMEHFPSLMTVEETAVFIERIEQQFEERGFGLWAVERVDTGDFTGFTGLAVPSFEAHFTPAVEVGWRLATRHWGQGYATEAAAAALGFGFGEAGLDEVVSFAVPANKRSLAVMERLGMSHDAGDDFDHPRFEPGSPFRRHVLFRMSAETWSDLYPSSTATLRLR